MSIPDQFPLRSSRAVTTMAAQPDAPQVTAQPAGRTSWWPRGTGRDDRGAPWLLQGRFLLAPPPGRPTLEQRLAAIGLADQGAAALAGARLAGQGNGGTA